VTSDGKTVKITVDMDSGIIEFVEDESNTLLMKVKNEDIQSGKWRLAVDMYDTETKVKLVSVE